jgi:hypothetical protein
MPTFNKVVVFLKGRLCVLAEVVHNLVIFWSNLTTMALSLTLRWSLISHCCVLQCTSRCTAKECTLLLEQTHLSSFVMLRLNSDSNMLLDHINYVLCRLIDGVRSTWDSRIRETRCSKCIHNLVWKTIAFKDLADNKQIF